MPPSWWHVAGVAAGTTLVWETLRAWLPSVMFIYGRAGSTPATELGLFGLIPFGLAVAAALAGRWAGIRWLFVGSGLSMGAARLVLQVTDGGDPQLWTATVGAVAALCWIVGLAGSTFDPRVAAYGLSGGLMLDTAWHAALRGIDLVWRPGVLPTVAVVGWVALFVAAAVVPQIRRSTASGRGAALPWVAVGPAFVLHGVVTGQVGRVQTAGGLSEPAAAALVVAAYGLGFVAAVGFRANRLAGVATAVLVVAGTPAALAARPPLVVAGTVVLAAGIVLAVVLAVSAAGAAPPWRRSLAAAAGLMLFFLLAFLYYASYDIALLPFKADALLVIAALVLLSAVWRTAAEGRSRRRSLAAAALLATSLVAAAALPSAVAARPATVPGDGWPLRVMTYNIHMGYDTRGRLGLEALAAVIRSQDPDVVALQEVDRGWLTTGATDVLPRLAALTGLPYVFAPAADPVWGNAILSRHPLGDVSSVPLPRGAAPMRRSLLSGTVAVGETERLGVVATHLHHVEEDRAIRERQAEAVADAAAAVAGTGLPVVVLGDFNAGPGDPELAPLTALLTDAATPPTYPSWAPERGIDHVFVSEGLATSDVAVPSSLASDHLAVAVTLTEP